MGVCLRSWIASETAEMYERHATYPRKVMDLAQHKFTDAKHIRSDVAVVGMPSTITFTGSKVEGSWEGMKRSLKEVLLLSSLGLPFVSMPACGTRPANVTNCDLMCLRWTQLASFMPGIHSWYMDDHRDRVPYMLPKSYQRYVRWALEMRYKLLPYFKTLDREWYSSFVPLVRPMFMEHRDTAFLEIWTQFMLGNNILVAPVLSGDTEFVNIKFPEGTWYLLGSGNPVNLPSQGANISFHTKPYEIPAFHRGGSVLVLYETPGFSIVDTEKSNFLITIALECAPRPRMGLCYAKGISYLNSETNQLNVTVSSLNGNGNMMLGVLDSPSPTLQKINSVIVSGVKAFGNILTVTWPGGTMNATSSLDNNQGSDPLAVYQADKQMLMLRNLNMGSSDYMDAIISWTFNQI